MTRCPDFLRRLILKYNATFRVPDVFVLKCRRGKSPLLTTHWVGTRRWTKTRNQVILSGIYNRQDPLEQKILHVTLPLPRHPSCETRLSVHLNWLDSLTANILYVGCLQLISQRLLTVKSWCILCMYAKPVTFKTRCLLYVSPIVTFEIWTFFLWCGNLNFVCILDERRSWRDRLLLT